VAKLTADGSALVYSTYLGGSEYDGGQGIAVDGGGPDVFVHYSAIESTGFRTLDEGQRVEFQTTQGPKGPQADQVHAI